MATMKLADLERRFGRGECIVARGSTERTLYVVHSGNVLIQINEGEAPYLLSSGDCFGELAAVLGRPSAFRAEAAEDPTSVLAIDVATLNTLVRECPEFAFRMIHQLAERVSHAREEIIAEAEALPAEAELVRVSSRDPRALAALARAILSRRIPGETPTPVDGRLKDLAEAARLDILEAYHCLQELLDKHWIGLVEQQLTVLEPDELTAISKQVG